MERADVVLENNRPGVLERLGLGYETLAKTKPDIIYARISGYGQDGPSGVFRSMTIERLPRRMDAL